MSDCAVCGEPEATYPSVFANGQMLCQDPVACLERVAKNTEDIRSSTAKKVLYGYANPDGTGEGNW